MGGSVSARDRLANGYSSASGVFAGLWVAQEGKLFEKYDIDSHLILIASGSMMVQAMLGGDLPIAGAAGSAAVDASLGGADVVMFGSMVKVPAFYIMALRRSNRSRICAARRLALPGLARQRILRCVMCCANRGSSPAVMSR
jgi:ABC-type nitrate/sulfonate/bicarbonate transport system substrate-binding protein